MDYSAVVSALVRTHPRFLFKNHHPLTGKSTRNLPSHRQSHHAAANDNDVTLRAHLHFLVAQTHRSTNPPTVQDKRKTGYIRKDKAHRKPRRRRRLVCPATAMNQKPGSDSLFKPFSSQPLRISRRPQRLKVFPDL